MSEESAFLVGIATHPNDDAPRLAFADWLDEHDRPTEAELIRVQIELEPIRKRSGEPRTDELLAREADLLRPFAERESERHFAIAGRTSGILAVYRRGFVDALHLPAQWLIAHGAALRAAYPLLRKLVAFRVNGWALCLASSAC